MPRKKYNAEGIVSKLRKVDVLVAQGNKVPEAVRSIGVTQVTYYRWRCEYGGLQTDQVKRMKELAIDNQRLRKAVSDLTLDKLILGEAAERNYYASPGENFVSSMFDVSSTSPSVEPVRRSDSIARRKERCRRGAMTKSA